MTERARQVHSLIFTNESGVTKNTYDDWCLLPASKPSIVLPPVKGSYVDILGANGSLDAVEALGSITYGDREESIEFYIEKYNTFKTFEALKREIANFLHGKKMSVQLASDPTVYYNGRWWIDDMHTEESWSMITLNYRLEPFGHFDSPTGSRLTF